MAARFALPLVSSFLILSSCYDKIEDEADVCVYTTAVTGQNVLKVLVQGFDGAGDHRGAYLRCTITVSGFDAHIDTVFKDGKDPNDALGPALHNSCEVVVEPGDYTLDFAGDERMITVPGDEHVCFGYDFITEPPF
jgi:hypothetical protein